MTSGRDGTARVWKVVEETQLTFEVRNEQNRPGLTMHCSTRVGLPWTASPCWQKTILLQALRTGACASIARPLTDLIDPYHCGTSARRRRYTSSRGRTAGPAKRYARAPSVPFAPGLPDAAPRRDLGSARWRRSATRTCSRRARATARCGVGSGTPSHGRSAPPSPSQWCVAAVACAGARTDASAGGRDQQHRLRPLGPLRRRGRRPRPAPRPLVLVRGALPAAKGPHATQGPARHPRADHSHRLQGDNSVRIVPLPLSLKARHLGDEAAGADKSA